MNRVLIALLGTGALLLAAGTAAARVASERISVSVTVISSCLASSNPSALADSATGGSPLSVSCSSAWPITVTLNADSVAGGLLAARMMNSAYHVPGSLYAPAAQLSAWANRSGSVASSSAALDNATYGQSFGEANPAPSAAASSGTVTVTISY
jgi:spore coat protein U-like protein